MKILCMMPAAKGVYPPEAEERRIAVMKSYATAATQIDVDYMPDVSGFSPWGGQGGPLEADKMARAHEFSARRAVQAEKDGYDAFCPYGLLDIGVLEARKRVSIPVVGQAEAAMLHCAMLGQPFASCSYMPGNEEHTRAHAASLGLEKLLVAITAIGIPNSEYPNRRKELVEQFVRCTREARDQGSALMGYVAMSICPGGVPAAELSAASGFPVLDALACQIATAEWWHRTGLPTSLLRSPRS
ncbi:MAG: aspartate/glutamate racemase family protein [Chloroflexota bacterium]